MKLVLDKPVTVAQGLTLEEADWGPWQFPQLLKRVDGQQSVRSRYRLPESQKRRRLYGEGQRLR